MTEAKYHTWLCHLSRDTLQHDAHFVAPHLESRDDRIPGAAVGGATPNHRAVHRARRERQYRAMRRSCSRAPIGSCSRAPIGSCSRAPIGSCSCAPIGATQHKKRRRRGGRARASGGNMARLVVDSVERHGRRLRRGIPPIPLDPGESRPKNLISCPTFVSRTRRGQRRFQSGADRSTIPGAAPGCAPGRMR